MKKPSVAECLTEVERLRAENERLKRLVATQRPELGALRDAECLLRDLCFNLPRKLEELHAKTKDLLGGNDDLPSWGEMRGILSNGRERVYAALESTPASAAVDPQVADTGKPTTRDEDSSARALVERPGQEETTK